MKKAVFIILSFLLLLLPVVPAASAEASQIPVDVQTNVNQKEIVVKGQLSTGSGQAVTIIIVNPKGALAYIGQTTSGEDGKYVFTYKPEAWVTGQYIARVGAEGLDQPVSVEFTLTDSDQGSGGGGGGNTGWYPPQRNDVLKVTSQQLSDHKDRKVVLELNEEIMTVTLPGNAADLLGDSKLELRSGQMSIIISPAMLQHLSDDPLSSIEIVFKQLSSGELQRLQQSNEDSSLRMNKGITAFHFELTYTSKDGKQRRPDLFMPVEVHISIDADAMDRDLIGLYDYDSTNNKWHYNNLIGNFNFSGKDFTGLLDHSGMYAMLEYHKKYEDVSEGFWGYRAITIMSAKHIAKGITAQTFAPDRTITRAEFAVLLARMLQLEEGWGQANAIPFRDVQSADWFYEEVALAYQAGLIQGRSQHNFSPNEYISREEMAVMIIRAQQLITGTKFEEANESNLDTYADQDQVASWAKPYVSASIRAGLMIGTGDRRFSPAQNTTRAEAVQVLYNLLKINMK